MSVLQELLNIGLVRVGPDDAIFSKIKTASSAFVKTMAEDPSLVVPATLIALDTDVSEDDPLYTSVERLLVEEWNTLRNTHVDRPCEILRSIIIDSLAEATRTSHEIAGIVWNSAASRLRHGHVRIGKAREVVQRILEDASDSAETEATRRAGLVAPTTRRRPRKTVSAHPSFGIDAAISSDEVIANITSSAGPSDPTGTTINDANPYWPDSGAAWSLEFAPRMTDAVVSAINLAIDRIGRSVEEKLPGEFVALENRLGDKYDEVVQVQSGSQMRMDVLWWSESLYSPSQRLGYHDLPPSVAAVTAAIDLMSIVPPLAPASVTYVLGETVRRIARILHTDARRCITDFLADLACFRMEFGVDLAGPVCNHSRGPLICLVHDAISGRDVSSEDIRVRAGVDGGKDLSLPDFAMWIFRELQALRLVETLR